MVIVVVIGWSLGGHWVVIGGSQEPNKATGAPRVVTIKPRGGIAHRLYPQPGSFALLGLEKKRVVLLDEWEFHGSAFALSQQLMWFEGKPLVITRPQNRDYEGHLMYEGTAPVFSTAKEKFVRPIVERAEVELQSNMPSVDTMLLRRLRLYSFFEKLPLSKECKIPECGACFSQMVLQYAYGL